METGDEFVDSGGSDLEDAIAESGSDTSNTNSDSSFDTSDSESDNVLQSARVWCKIGNTVPASPAPPNYEFKGTPSVNFVVNEDADVLFYFHQFFDNNLVKVITDETNRYASQCQENSPGTSNRAWQPVSCDEIHVFLALNILQSIVRKPELTQYWSKNPMISTPFFSQCMSSRRFLQIKQYLHFSNNEDYNPENHPNAKLNKIWPIYDVLVGKFRDLCTPCQHITIDESLLLYKGRLGWVQYIPLKRARYGIKTYLLCESKSGYVWNFLIYTGKGTVIGNEFRELPVSSQVVMNLAKPLLNKGYCLTMDNFYNSPQLADLLISYKTDVYGTLRATRKDVPKSLRETRLQHGETISYQRGKLLVMKWKDKKDICLISTVHNTEMTTVVKRGEEKKKPKLVVDYNDTMGGVDRVDQHLSDYAVPRKRGKKYYRKIFFHLLDLSLWNSFILYRKCGGNKSALQYRMELVKLTIEKFHHPEFAAKHGRPGKTPTPMRLTGRHFPETLPPTEKKSNPTRQCGMCSRVHDAKGKRIRRETRYFCPDCNVPLCVAPCFRVYHTASQI